MFTTLGQRGEHDEDIAYSSSHDNDSAPARVAELEKRLATIEGQLARIEAATSGAAQGQPAQVSTSLNTKLSQAIAENGIRTYAGERPIYFRGGGNGCSLTPQSIGGIGPLSQFADAQASTVVVIRCAGGGMPLTFVFQRDVNARWFLTKIDHQAQFDVDDQLMRAVNQSLSVPYAITR